MPKRSPFEKYHKRQRQINAKVFDLMQSTAHMCLCNHPQGFHWNTDDGENLGQCVDAECPCEAFDEDVLYEARLRAEMAAGGTANRDEAVDDDALARAMRAEQEGREIRSDETWERVLNAKRPNPIGKSRPDTLHNSTAMDALRELGGSPEDLTGT